MQDNFRVIEVGVQEYNEGGDGSRMGELIGQAGVAVAIETATVGVVKGAGGLVKGVSTVTNTTAKIEGVAANAGKELTKSQLKSISALSNQNWSVIRSKSLNLLSKLRESI